MPTSAQTPSTTPAAVVDPSRCPLCGQHNVCAMASPGGCGQTASPCWCTTAHFSAALLQSVPAAAQHKACICAACAASAPQASA